MPKDADNLALEIRRVYAQAEQDVISRIANRIPEGKSLDIHEWEMRKLKQLQKVRNGIDMHIHKKLDNFHDEETKDLLEKVYRQGTKEGIADLKKVESPENITAGFGRIDEQTVARYTEALTNRLKGTHMRIVRQADDVYRRAVSRGVNTVLTGSGTRVEGAQRVLNEFANRGVHGFRDAADRNWNLSSYAEMATRTSAQRARIDGRFNKYQQNGYDLVVVSAHAESCPICDPWEGQVLSISGKSEEYPSKADARSAGLWHPNCGHNATLYIEGVTEKPEQQPGDESYKNRKQQRYNERNIRKWKRRKAGAMTEREKMKAQRKVQEWQARQKEFIEKTDRYRKYEREAIDTAN